jgi:hypothetical protein
LGDGGPIVAIPVAQIPQGRTYQNYYVVLYIVAATTTTTTKSPQDVRAQESHHAISRRVSGTTVFLPQHTVVFTVMMHTVEFEKRKGEGVILISTNSRRRLIVGSRVDLLSTMIILRVMMLVLSRIRIHSVKALPLGADMIKDNVAVQIVPQC